MTLGAFPRLPLWPLFTRNSDELLVNVVPPAFSVSPPMLRNHPQPHSQALTGASDPQGLSLHLLWTLSIPTTSLHLAISPMSLLGALVCVPVPFVVVPAHQEPLLSPFHITL